MAPEAEYVVDFPTLWVAADWIEAHCVVPDGFRRGEPWEMYDWQLWCTVNHYRVRPDAEVGQLAPAFHSRRSQVIGPQKCGKGPWSASIVAAEAAGPVLFAGWARGGEVYDCRDHGCGCGWTYQYQRGEPMGQSWPTPLIQILATSEDQADNVYRPLKAMIKLGPLAERIRVGEEFSRIGDEGRIDVVTSSANARLGNPVTFPLMDESGTYTAQNKLRKVAETMRRGAAGMGGRSMETTNPWDPAEDSVAQSTWESKRPDIFKFWRQPPARLSYTDRRERHQIHRHVYAGCRHVDLDAIEAEAAELLERDPGQAARFFGNLILPGVRAYMPSAPWAARAEPREVPDGTPVVLGFDGADVDDWTAIRAETRDGYQFTPAYGNGLPCIWNPADFGGQVPRLEVDAAMRELDERYHLVRAYCDPPYWESEIDQWAADLGEGIILRWYTRSLTRMWPACERLVTDVTKAGTPFRHDGCADTRQHMENARKSPRPGGEPGKPRYVLAKPSPAQKIDLTVSSILAHQAAGDAIAAGEFKAPRQRGQMVVRR
jgi:hypothetical protein